MCRANSSSDFENPNSRMVFNELILQIILFHERMNLINMQRRALQDDTRNILEQVMTENGWLRLKLFLDCPISRHKIFKAIINNIFEVMTNQFGHLLFMDLVPLCTPSQLINIVKEFKSNTKLLITVLQNKNGSNSFLKLMEKLNSEVPILLSVVRLMGDELYTIMTHQSGKYLIRKSFILLDGRAAQILYKALITKCEELVMHEVGSICLKDCIEFMNDTYRDNLLAVLCDRSVLLSMNPSATHVLEYIINRRHPVYTDYICSCLQGNYIRLSMEINGCYLVQTCLSSCGIRYVIEEFVANNDKLLQVACDQYGNLVIQIALQMTMAASDKELHWSLLQAIKSDMQSLKSHPIGKVVYRLMKCAIPSS